MTLTSKPTPFTAQDTPSRLITSVPNRLPLHKLPWLYSAQHTTAAVLHPGQEQQSSKQTHKPHKQFGYLQLHIPTPIMAVPSSPKLQVYHSPNPDRNRMRRGSSRKSFTSPSIPVTPMIESPRTLCPKDTDAFSYDPTQLSAWYVAQELWDRLPSTLQASLTAMQRAGAAVDTGE